MKHDGNVARALFDQAAAHPESVAVIDGMGSTDFRSLEEACRITALGLRARGLGPGDRVVVLVPPSSGLLALFFALVAVGAVPVFIDPAMGRAALVKAIAQAAPVAFIGIARAHLLRLLHPRAFRTVKRFLLAKKGLWTVGSAKERRAGAGVHFELTERSGEDPALIAFTSGSTGPPKGVVLHHGLLASLLAVLRDHLQLVPGETDLATFAFFAFLSPALGRTAVLPAMDFSRPGTADPARILAAIAAHRPSVAFGSPALWRNVVAHCQSHQLNLSPLRKVISAGAPVPLALVSALRGLLPEGEVLTPYGMTEGLPVTLISGAELLARAARNTEGVCVGRPAPGLQVEVLKVEDGPLPTWSPELRVPQGALGEVTISGPWVSRHYLERPDADALAKVADGERAWHRTGDLGFFDPEGLLWLCGRKSERVRTPEGVLHPLPIEAHFLDHPAVQRCALVGVGPAENQRPVLVVEARSPAASGELAKLQEELLAIARAHPATRSIQTVLWHPRLPVDARHNAKLRRDLLGEWARQKLEKPR